MQLTPLSNSGHKSLKVLEDTSLIAFKEQHLIPVTYQEFAKAAAEFPVVFVKHPETGQLRSVIMAGVKPGQSLYAGQENWPGIYIPSICRLAPFGLLPNEETQQDDLAIDLDSALVQEQEGLALFDENGEDSEFLKARRAQIQEHIEAERVGGAITQQLMALELFTEQRVSLTIHGEKIDLSGVYTIDDSKLQQLDQDTFLDLRKRGILPALYAQMGSMLQLQRLAKLANT